MYIITKSFITPSLQSERTDSNVVSTFLLSVAVLELGREVYG